MGKYLFRLNNKDIRITFLSVAVVFCYCCCYCCCCGGRVVCFCFLFWFVLFFYADLKQVFLQSRNCTCAKVVLFKKVLETLKLSESSFEVLTKTLRCQNVSNSPIQKHFFQERYFSIFIDGCEQVFTRIVCTRFEVCFFRKSFIYKNYSLTLPAMCIS